jgi:conserved oligomeric Golgi complex subunit 5
MVGRVAASTGASAAASPSQMDTGAPAERDESAVDATPLATLLSSLSASPTTAPFLSASLPPSHHLSTTLRSNTLTSSLATAQSAASSLTSAILAQVSANKTSLLTQVSASTHLTNEISALSTSIESLSTTTSALSDALALPFAPMTASVAALHNISHAGALLRDIALFRASTRRLAAAGGLYPSPNQAVKTPPSALPGAAAAVRDIEDLLSSLSRSPGFDKVELIARAVPAAKRASAELRKRTTAMLKAGVAARDTAAVAAAVLAFRDLGVLTDRVNAEVARLCADVASAVHRGLGPASGVSVRGPGGGPGFLQGGSGSAAGGRAGATANDSNGIQTGGEINGDGGDRNGRSPSPSRDVWTRVDAMLDAIRDACAKAFLLQHVLSTHYDEVTHVSLLHEPIAAAFVDAVSTSLAEHIALLASTYRSHQHKQMASNRTHNQMQTQQQMHVFAALAADYPRLRKSLVTLADRVYAVARPLPYPITFFLESPVPSCAPSSSSSAAKTLPIVPGREFIQSAFVSTVSDVETHYLSVSLDRLTSSVSVAFEAKSDDGSKSSATPSFGGADGHALNLARLFAAELSASRADADLFNVSVTNVSKALRLYTSNAEDYAAATAPDNDSVNQGLAIVSDWHLTDIYNGLVTLSTASRRVLGSDDDHASLPPSIAKEVAAMSGLADMLLKGMFATCASHIKRTLLGIHTEDMDTSGGLDGCSTYAIDMTTQVSMFADGLIPVLARSRNLSKLTLRLARSVLDSFVRQATLVFPFQDSVRGRIATDMARIELAVESLCPVRMLGESYTAIRALRRVLFMTDDELSSAPSLPDFLETVTCITPSAVAHHILSRCSDDTLLHPHRRQNISPADYSLWLDSNSEDDAWAAVQDSIKAHESCRDVSAPPCPQYTALKALSRCSSGPLRDQRTAARPGEEW